MTEFLEGDYNLNFDHIVGNPPYQGNGKADKIWYQIVSKCLDLLKENGQMNMIHPGSWRFGTDKSSQYVKKINRLYRKYNLIKLETHDMIEGKETFGVSTDYDVIHLIKEPYKHKTRYISKTDNKLIDLSQYLVIPTDNIGLFNKLKAKNDNDRVEIIRDSAYHHMNNRTSKSKDDNFKYPCIYTITEKNGAKYIYSRTKDKGHFGKSKLIMKDGANSSVIDFTGSYGMTEFAFGIVDKPYNLIRMQKALFGKEFRQLKTYFIGTINQNNPIDGLGHMTKFLKEFKKDFWKEFYTPEMEQELIDEGKIDKEGNLILL